MLWNARMLLVLFALIGCCGSDGCVEVGVVDESFHVAEDSVELYPMQLPVALAVDETVEDDTLLPEALTAWNAWVEREATAAALVGETPRVLVSIGLVGTPEWSESIWDIVDGVQDAEVTNIDYAEDGEILGAEIIISSDVAYHRPTVLTALEHAIGHAVFGLADDPGPPTTVELQSIMASPMDPLGVLTEHDRALLEPYLTW